MYHKDFKRSYKLYNLFIDLKIEKIKKKQLHYFNQLI